MAATMNLVVGLGKTGYSIARYLQRRGEPFAVFDTRAEPNGLSEFYTEFPNIDVYLGAFPEALYTQLKAVISSPGISMEADFIQNAQRLGIPVYGDIECLVKEIDAPLVTITGTNGKSTVTTLVGEMAKSFGLTVAVGGNIGLPVLDILDVGVTYDLWVLELSSFQLEQTQHLQSTATTILNVSPDHLDRHHAFENYVAAKHRIYQNAKYIVSNRQDSKTFPNEEIGQFEKLVSFGFDAPKPGHWGLIKHQEKIYLSYGDNRFLAVNDLKIKGRHNWLNALAACALAHFMGIDLGCMVEVLKRFSGLPHRSQWVRTLKGVDWINDSKGTNVGATVSSITGIGNDISGKIVLIAGGQGKDADFSDLREPAKQFVRTVILFGEDADKIENALEGAVPIRRTASMKKAVELARNEAMPQDVVLMSPACASFDMFRDFNHRGEEFIAMVNDL